jgi:superfamily I DNA/RNA helicase
MRLPTYQELSKEQDAINDLPLEGSYLVTGPPGTGKTVMALYRTHMLNEAAAPVQLLMFSRLLSQYVEGAVDELDLEGTVRTFHSWFCSFYKQIYRSMPPQVERYVYDWPEVLAKVSGAPPAKAKTPFLIVDEGQDLPRDFYMVAEYLSKNITVFADENQKLTQHNSTLDDIRLYSGINGNVHQLRRNYRNTRQIAEFARHYCVDTQEVPELPDRQGKEKPVVLNHGTLDETIKFIRVLASNNDDLQIGVFTQTVGLQSEICRRLKKHRLPVSSYRGGRGRAAARIDFSEPGILVVNYPSAKGLEFDIVVIPELQTVSLDIRNPQTRMLFYVLLSRAREELYLCFSGRGEPPLISDIPEELVIRRG